MVCPIRFGLISYGDDDDEVFIGRDLAHTRGYSEDVAKAIDSEIHSIIEECHDNAKKIISEHMEVLHGCAKLLLEKEKFIGMNLKHFLQWKNRVNQMKVYNMHKK